MLDIERRKSPLARQAVAVLRIEGIESLDPYTAGIVHRFGVSVGTDHAEPGAEAFGDFQAACVVVPVASVVHQLDDTELLGDGIAGGVALRKRGSRSQGGSPGNGLVGIQETIQVAAQRTEVASFHHPVVAQLPLHVHQIFHRIGRTVRVRVHEGERRGNLGLGSPADCGKRGVPENIGRSRIRVDDADAPSDVARHVEQALPMSWLKNTPAPTRTTHFGAGE